MDTTALTAALFTSLTLLAQPAPAQEYTPPTSSYGYAVRPPTYGPSVIYHHASTFEEGYLRGQADWLRGMGDYLYSRSLAAINNEEARRRFVENKQFAADTYFQMRETNREARFADIKRPSREQLERYAKERAPQRLSPSQFDTTLGVVQWPALLQDAAFATEREHVDRLMSARSFGNSGPDSENCQQVTTLVDDMQQKLKTRINEFSPQQYVAAKQFLTGLKAEARLTAGVDGLAAR